MRRTSSHPSRRAPWRPLSSWRFAGQVRATTGGLLAALVLSPVLVSAPAQADDAPPGPQSAPGGGLELVGTMERPLDRLYRPMAVDEERSLGFVAGPEDGFDSPLSLMDLEGLEKIAETPTHMVGGDAPGGSLQRFGFTPESSLALDPTREWLYATGSYHEAVQPSCSVKLPPTQSGPRMGQPVFDYRPGSDGQPAVVERRMGPMPCTGDLPFAGLVGSYDTRSKRLYLGGTTSAEMWRPLTQLSVMQTFSGGTFRDDRGQSLLLRQLEVTGGDLAPFDDHFAPDAAELILEWELDLRVAGCGRRNHRSVGSTIYDGFVARFDDFVLAYCWDGRAYRGLQFGQQGYIVRIPLVPDPENPDVMRPATRGDAEPLRSPDGPPESITNFVYDRVPTLPGNVTSILDRASGRVMLVTTDPTNGNAVWVFDPHAMRFIGVVTGGDPDQPEGNTAVGFDSRRGRVYVLTQDGILVAHIRSTPLPSGVVYPVLQNSEGVRNFVGSSRISVAPALGRLFVDRGTHYDVVEDHVPDPPAVREADPDALTTQVDEAPGTTTRSVSAQALASGIHLVNAGGAPRVVGQTDPTCITTPPNIQTAMNDAGTQDPVPDWEPAPALVGSCLPEFLLSSGHREAEIAATALEAGNQSGVTARGSTVAFGSADKGTDGDVSRFGDCGAGTPDDADGWGRNWLFPENATLNGARKPDGSYVFPDPVLAPGGNPNYPGSDKREHIKAYNDARDAFWNHPEFEQRRREGQDDYGAGCNAMQDEAASAGGPDLRTGTRGADGRGFPVPAATCTDFGGSPGSEGWPQGLLPVDAAITASMVSCDAGGPAAAARSRVGAALPPGALGDAPVAVGGAASEARSHVDERGQVTTVTATATDVVVGPLAIAEIRSTAESVAKGRRATSVATIDRRLCGVSVAGALVDEGCIRLDGREGREAFEEIIEEVNRALLHKVQLSLADAAVDASPGGYQAVVTKDPGQRGADSTVNDDTSHTVSALQMVVYNDGPKGRSRIIVQLAGVHAEARYGITVLPRFSGFEDSFSAGTSAEGTPATRRVIPGTRRAPSAATVIEGEAFEELFSTTAPLEENPIRRFLGFLPDALEDLWRLFVQHPLEFLLLFFVFSLLATPAYLAYRRRTFVGVLSR